VVTVQKSIAEKRDVVAEVTAQVESALCKR